MVVATLWLVSGSLFVRALGPGLALHQQNIGKNVAGFGQQDIGLIVVVLAVLSLLGLA